MLKLNYFRDLIGLMFPIFQVYNDLLDRHKKNHTSISSIYILSENNKDHKMTTPQIKSVQNHVSV